MVQTDANVALPALVRLPSEDASRNGQSRYMAAKYNPSDFKPFLLALPAFVLLEGCSKEVSAALARFCGRGFDACS